MSNSQNQTKKQRQNPQPHKTPELPEAYYREVFYQRILSHKSKNVLDIGCGDGALLMRLKADGIKACGLEPDEEKVAMLRQEGLRAVEGFGEMMPFQNDEFDMVVSEFSAHHMAKFDTVIVEALRVARRGVIILDQWYDKTIASSALTERFDRWCKQIDRAAGEVHFPSFTSASMLEAFEKQPTPVKLIAETHYVPMAIPIDGPKAYAAEQLEKITPDKACQEEWAVIFAEAERIGFSENGALIVTAMK